MARVVAHLPDLLFGSKVDAMLVAAGHDVSPAGSVEGVPEADLLVLDLCEGSAARLAQFAPAIAATRTLAFYLHTDVDTRTAALAAGCDLVVPRSRMAREGASLVERLLAADVGACGFDHDQLLGGAAMPRSTRATGRPTR